MRWPGRGSDGSSREGSGTRSGSPPREPQRRDHGPGWPDYVLLGLGVFCLGVIVLAVFNVAEDDDFERLLFDTAVFWGAGQEVPTVRVGTSTCARRSSAGTTGRYSSSRLWAECQVHLSGPPDVVPGGDLRYDIDLSWGELEREQVRGAVQWRGRVTARWGAGVMTRRWLNWLERLWVLPFVGVLSLGAIVSPILLSRARRRRRSGGA